MHMINQGNRDAFTCLLTRHIKPVHAHVYRFFQDQALADDISQETFLRVWSKSHTWRGGKVKLTTWLHRITHNLCIDQLRKNKPNDELDEDKLVAQQASLDEQLEQLEVSKQVQLALMRLPVSQRSALILCQFQGLTNKEAASILQTSVRALESLLARARRTLKQQLLRSV